MLRRLPPVVQDLLKLAFGFYVAISAIAIFANWNSPNRIAVIMVLLIGLVIVLILEAIAAGLAWLAFKPRKPRTSKG